MGARGRAWARGRVHGMGACRARARGRARGWRGCVDGVGAWAPWMAWARGRAHALTPLQFVFENQWKSMKILRVAPYKMYENRWKSVEIPRESPYKIN